MALFFGIFIFFNTCMSCFIMSITNFIIHDLIKNLNSVISRNGQVTENNIVVNSLILLNILLLTLKNDK